MVRCLPFVILLTTILSPLPSTLAQSSRRYYLPPSDFGRLGLEQAWTTHVQLDSSRSQVNSIVLQIVGMHSYETLQTASYQVHEIRYDGHALRFSERDLGPDGQVIGRDEAQRLAEKQMILLEARGLKPELTLHEVPPSVVYVQSDRGTLHAIDGETGNTLWSLTIGNPQWPMIQPAANDQFVATINGSSLYVIDRESGEPIWDQPIGMNPTLSLAMSDEFVFVPGVSGQVEAYRLPTAEDDFAGAPPWIYHAGTRITSPPFIGGSTVAWGNLDGHVFVAALAGPQMLYRRETNGAVHGSVGFLPPNRLVIATLDGYVTALDELDGTLVWSYSAGFDLYQSPVVNRDATFVVTRQGHLVCVNSADGSERWTARGVQQVLACGTERVYVSGDRGTLMALDKQTGARLGVMALPAYQLAYTNSLTDRIYLLTTSGTLLCLRPVDAYFPTIHRPLAQPEQEATTAEGATAPEASAPSAGPAAPGGVFGDTFMEDSQDQDDESSFDPFAPIEESAEPSAPAPGPGPGPAPEEEDEEFDDPFDFG